MVQVVLRSIVEIPRYTDNKGPRRGLFVHVHKIKGNLRQKDIKIAINPRDSRVDSSTHFSLILKHVIGRKRKVSKPPTGKQVERRRIRHPLHKLT